MISSVDNSKIKDVCRLVAKKKERYSRALFVAEGEKLVFEAPRDRVVSVFCTEDFAGKHQEKLIPGITEIVSDKVFAKMSDTDTPQGVLAVVRMADAGYSLRELLSQTGDSHRCAEEIKDKLICDESERPDESCCGNTSEIIYKREGDEPRKTGGAGSEAPLILYLENIKDPGNLGTIVRSAEAAGVTGVVMSEGTADIYSPKVVRSTMGSIYRVPFIYTADIYSELESAKKRGIRLYAAYLKSSIPYYAADFTEPCGILIGNEAAGLSDKAAGQADERIIIPMSGAVESLNAAMAAGVIAFEARRQRAG